ncbi:hypothetical protein C7974DRAFT_468839 [Boeremia exigua]|uniref:uncharacterized protein n=1 Tax=Boeremia exigua TaxID=749465 RepID=UPI001E8DB648|nr:uncharacterized protein C7974DRAFT_468839 [Boeremia exigua]KAH6642491.1 hypothetical protein C7974DRAFT_468839 [Boeremia exigua]
MSSSATLPLSAIAKAISRFILGEAQLPVLLSHFRTFFTGVAIGAVGCPALWAYLTRNKCDRAKVQLAVYHIVRLLEDRPHYKALLHDPQQLMNLIEPEVMRLVKKHLTLDEVIEAAKEVKREHVPLATDEPVKKRVKKDRASAKPRRRAVVNPAFIPTPRGFLPPSPSDPEWLQFENASVSDESESDESDVDLDMTDEAAAAPVHSAEGLQEVARGEGKQPVQRVTPMHAPEQGSFGLDYNSEDLYASPPGSPSHSSSSSFSSSSSSAEDLELPPSQPAYDNSEPRWLQEMVAASKGGPKKGRSNGVIRSSPAPAVVRMLHGNRCSGTTLSPIQGSPSITEDPRAPTEAEQAFEPAAAKSAPKLPFGHWSTSAPLEYSSSSSSSSQEAALSACSPTPSMPSSSMSVSPMVNSPAPSLPSSSLGSSPTPSKRKSPSASDAPAPKRRSLSPRLQSPASPASPAQQPAAPALSPAPASSIPSPPVSLSPAASVSSSSSGSSLTPQKRKSPSTTDAYALKRRRLSPPTATPARTPRPLLKRGRGRGRTGDREPRELKYVPRKSPRSTAYTGSYTK